VARNRQKAKERQARRKAKERSAGDGAPSRDGADGKGGNAASPPPKAKPKRSRPDRAPEPERTEPEPAPKPTDPDPEPEPVLDPYLQAGAPPEDVGRSDEVLDYQQDLDSVDDDEGHYDPAEDMAEDEMVAGPKGRRGDQEAEKHKDRPRFVQFLFAVVRELQRVQWPDRPALTTLTGVVLGFVLIAGGYLGALDAIFSRIIQAIL
jgi:preprotein translocase subunit SecE